MWESRNAVCCHFRGENPDKKGRGGIKIVDGENLVYHCFNCGYTASYYIGKPLYPKFIKLLEWLGLDERLISQLKLENLKLINNPLLETNNQPVKKTFLKSIDLPQPIELLENQPKYSKHIDFLNRRGFTPNDYSFLISDNIIYRNRVMIPFILENTMIGYSARSIVNDEKTRYIMKMNNPFVFGLDFVKPKYEWIILSEGLFDALSIKGLAVMHNEINEEQINLINDLQKRIIVVPDLDKAGLSKSNSSLINTALDNNWDVSFPEWKYKDINEAFVDYGPLFVIKHILDVTTNSQTMIKVKQKMFLNKIKG